MTNVINLPWIARNLSVIDSSDPSLVGVSGLILDETKRTISLDCNGHNIKLAKNVIHFTLDNNTEKIDGSLVSQRPEDRINRKYRRN